MTGQKLEEFSGVKTLLNDYATRAKNNPSGPLTITEQERTLYKNITGKDLI